MNRVLREDEWNNLPSGLLDQVDIRVVVADIFWLQLSQKVKVQIISCLSRAFQAQPFLCVNLRCFTASKNHLFFPANSRLALQLFAIKMQNKLPISEPTFL